MNISLIGQELRKKGFIANWTKTYLYVSLTTRRPSFLEVEAALLDTEDLLQRVRTEPEAVVYKLA